MGSRHRGRLAGHTRPAVRSGRRRTADQEHRLQGLEHRGASDSGTITIKVGSNTHKIDEIVIVADCDGDKERVTRRNVKIKDDGRFRLTGGGYLSIVGRFRTKHWVTGSITAHQCGFFGGDFSARDN